MAIVRRIVCLANSRKLSGRCIAGRELLGSRPGPWIRPVSAREHEEVSENERQFKDGSDPRLLDIIDLPLLEPRANPYQRENWLLDPTEYWVRVGRFSPTNLTSLVGPTGTLWLNGCSSYNGQNDRIPTAQAEADSSLSLISVNKLSLKVFAPGEAFGNPKRRVQARFRSCGADYWLFVTDPVVEREYLRGEDGEYPLDGCYLTVSVGEPYDGFSYKFVAGLIDPTTDGGAQ